MQEILNTFSELAQSLFEAEIKEPTAKTIPADELYERLDIKLSEKGISKEELKKSLSDIVKHTPKTASTTFFNQLFGGRNEHAVIGDLMAVLLNNSMYTYKAAGAMVGVEKSLIRETCNLIGWDENSDGTFASGGSLTNFMSMLMARDAADSKSRFEGAKQQYTVYTSEQSHYSIPKNAAFSGVGRNNVRFIESDNLGRMKPEVLEESIKNDISNGYLPILINATAGTTVMGEFDDIEALSVLAKKYNVWLHVDGAYCGSVIYSKKYKHLIKGVENADSFSLNAHKMLGTPLTCSLIMVKDKQHLYDSFANDAEYLYQTDHDDFNLGKTSLQCGRRNDALKLWCLWKAVGTEGLEEIVNKQFALSEVAHKFMSQHPDKYKVFSTGKTISVCFNYKDLNAKELCTDLYTNGILLVGYGQFHGVEFVRLVTVNAQNSAGDILNFFKKLEEFAEIKTVKA